MKKLSVIFCWGLPAILGLIILSQIIWADSFKSINLHAVAAVIGIISLILNAIVFRPAFGSSRVDGPEPKKQVQRLLHAVFTAVLIFLMIKYF